MAHKEAYIAPEFKISTLDNEDIIRTSADNPVPVVLETKGATVGTVSAMMIFD